MVTGIVGQAFEVVRDPRTKLKDVAKVVGVGIQSTLQELVPNPTGKDRKEIKMHVEIFELTPDANRKYQVSARIFDSMSVPHDYEHLFKNKVTPIDMLAAPFSNDPTIDWKKELSTFVICQDGEYEFLYRAKKLLQREKKYSWQPQTGSFLMAVVAASLYSQDRGGNSEVAVPFALVTVRSDKFTLTNEMDEHCEKLLELACQPLILQKQEDALNEEADNLAKAERARQMRFDQLESLPQSNNAGP